MVNYIYEVDAVPSPKGVDKAGLRRNAILLDGPFKGDYSLAIVNRNLARSLLQSGFLVRCYSNEQDWRTDAKLKEMSDVYDVMLEDYPAPGKYKFHLRNPWPPETSDMVGQINSYVCFAWEETEIPVYMVERFNRDLDFMMVTSNFVKQALKGSGVTIPIDVIGNGCDHVLRSEERSFAAVKKIAAKRVLHVSSCFPRKGAELLVDAYCDTFNQKDDVELFIKTTPNPHNQIARYVEEALKSRPFAPMITVVNEHWDNSHIAALYKTADLLVAPSKGEGFGLPFAEAMLFGVPVATTAFSGQTDFCTSDTSYPISYSLAASESHVSSGYSLWAEPSVASIQAVMRQALGNPQESKRRTEAGRKLILAELTWARVAERVEKCLFKAPENGRYAVHHGSEPKIDLITTWHQKCGIATYSEHLYSTEIFSGRIGNIFSRIVLDEDRIETSDASDGRLQRVWSYDYRGIDRLIASLQSSNNPILWWQHHPGHFSNQDMLRVTDAVANSGYKVSVITMHNVKEIALKGELQWATRFDAVFVHSAGDAALLSEVGQQNVFVIPHGFQRLDGPKKREGASFTVGTFGFLFKHKNIDLLVAAVGRVRSTVTDDVRLMLLNCVTDASQSLEAQRQTETVIDSLNMREYVETDYSFLPEEEIVSRLSECDLLVFPYGESHETATGAVRVALLAGAPILCSTSPVLNDLAGISHRVRDLSVTSLAEAITILMGNKTMLYLYDLDAKHLMEAFSYEKLALRYRWFIDQKMGRAK
ncbi:glycosyltransferase [Rhizobium sp. CFBP 8752]|uniref:glycosyltransferase family 4 protein n=1 Tax=Rhizobium sp. CFBP 8752 TaxID=2775301 RepID=UPI001780F487|nr:glycosyltransferase [Rhizobium sp. CFBP 8752]MBD8665907.1 glycosyltransferase [Rhizobium sp. CFBP 8752]